MKSGGRQLTQATPFEVSIGVRSAQIGDETVVFDLLRDKCYRLNSTGTRIWELLSRGTSLGEVTDHLTKEFRLKRSEASETANTYLGELVALGLAASSSTIESKSEGG